MLWVSPQSGSPVVGGGGQLASQGSIWPCPHAGSHQPRRGLSALTQTKAPRAREHSTGRRPRGRVFPTAPSFARRARPPPGSSQHHLRKAPRWRPLPWTCLPRSYHLAGGSPRLSPWSSPPPGDWPPQGGRGPSSVPVGRCGAHVGAPWAGGLSGWMSITRGAHLGPLLTPICSWPPAARARKARHPHLPFPGPGDAVWAGAGLCSVPVIPWCPVPEWAGHARWARAMQLSRVALTPRAVQRQASAGRGGSWPGSRERGSSLERQGRAPSWQGMSPLVPPCTLSLPPTVRPWLRLTFPSTSPSALGRLCGPPAKVSPRPTTAAGPQTPSHAQRASGGPPPPSPSIWSRVADTQRVAPRFSSSVSPHCVPVHVASQK